MTLPATQTVDRALPNRRVRCLLLGMQDVMGKNGLNATLNLAKLQRYIGLVPPANSQRAMRASEFAALLQSIEAQFGSGARGQLSRIGQATFKQTLAQDALGWQLLALTNRLRPAHMRMQRSLDKLAFLMAEPDGNITVRRDAEQLVFTNLTSDGTYGRSRNMEICWLTMGEIQECIHWATGHTYDVSEIACKAKGDPACAFVIGDRVG